MLGTGRGQDRDPVFGRQLGQGVNVVPCDDGDLIGTDSGGITPFHAVVNADEDRRYPHKSEIDLSVHHSFADAGRAAELLPVDFHTGKPLFQKLLLLHDLKRGIGNAVLLGDSHRRRLFPAASGQNEDRRCGENEQGGSYE